MIVGGFRYFPIHILVINVVLVRRYASSASRRGLWRSRLLNLPRQSLIGQFLLLHAERRRSVVTGRCHGQVAQIGIELDLVVAQVERANIGGKVVLLVLKLVLPCVVMAVLLLANISLELH